jgi:hypothetical protein
MRATGTLKKLFGPTQSIDGIDSSASVTIRYARPDDRRALMDLAYLDSSYAPYGVVLVAEVDGRLWAALSLEDGHAVADPFRPSGELAFLLAERARQVAKTMPRERQRRRTLTPSAA